MEEAFFGELRLLAFNFTPDGSLKCEGQRMLLSKLRSHIRAEPLVKILATRFGDPKDPESIILPKLELESDDGEPSPLTLALNLRGMVVGAGGPMPAAINGAGEDALLGEIRLMPNYMLEDRGWARCNGAAIDGDSFLVPLIGYAFGGERGRPRLPKLASKPIPDVREEPLFKLNAALVPDMDSPPLFKPPMIDRFKGGFSYAICTEGLYPQRF